MMLFMKRRAENCSVIVRPIFCAADGILIQTTGTAGSLLRLKTFTPVTFRRLLSPNHKKNSEKLCFGDRIAPFSFSESKNSAQIDLAEPEKQSFCQLLANRVT